MINYRNRALDLIVAIRKINDALFKEGAPAGSDNYFKIRHMLVEQIHIGIGDNEDAYLARVKEAALSVKVREAPKAFAASFFDPSDSYDYDGEVEGLANAIEERDAKVPILADFALRCLEGGAR